MSTKLFQTILFLTILTLSVTSCKEKKKLTNPFQLGETVTLPFGQTADCANCQDVNIVIAEVKDNRCPKGVNCVQAGQADATFAISGSINQTVELTLGGRGKKAQAKVGGYTLTLKAVNPYPEDGVKVKKTQKEVVFVLEGA